MSNPLLPRSCKAKVTLLQFIVKLEKCNGSSVLVTPKMHTVVTLHNFALGKLDLSTASLNKLKFKIVADFSLNT